MAEFVDVMLNAHRMCHSNWSCEKCDIKKELDNCFLQSGYYDYKTAESVIMRWAKQHPEPVYPTWLDWLIEIGVIPREEINNEIMSLTNYVSDFVVHKTKLLQAIQPDIAQKLGIPPINQLNRSKP